jgi:hypothetical protein
MRAGYERQGQPPEWSQPHTHVMERHLSRYVVRVVKRCVNELATLLVDATCRASRFDLS